MRHLVLGVLAFAAVFGPAPRVSANAPDPVYWDADWTKLTIDAGHVAHYRFHPTGWGASGRQDRSVDAKVSDADFAALERVFVAQSACGFLPSQRHPLPEEHSKTLTLALPSLQCTVTMLSNDWYAAPRPNAVATALDALIQKIAP
jgi:hypothetical protein